MVIGRGYILTLLLVLGILKDSHNVIRLLQLNYIDWNLRNTFVVHYVNSMNVKTWIALTVLTSWGPRKEKVRSDSVKTWFTWSVEYTASDKNIIWYTVRSNKIKILLDVYKFIFKAVGTAKSFCTHTTFSTIISEERTIAIQCFRQTWRILVWLDSCKVSLFLFGQFASIFF